MRRTVIKITLFICTVASMSCSKYTDITPKGQNLLNTAEDLELLMNVNYSAGFRATNQSILINDFYPNANIPDLINSPSVTMEKVLVTFDESTDRASLTLTDETYEKLYETISRVCNIILANAEKATGDPQLLKQLKAEAYIIRAYLHFRLVNIYSKAYSPSTSASDGGIPYVTDIDFEKVNTKKTVKEVYENLLADIQSSFALKALPNQPINAMRAGMGFAYAVKAKVLMSMGNYSGALRAADSALVFNNFVADHRQLLSKPFSERVLERPGILASDNVFFVNLQLVPPNGMLVSPEVLNTFYEQGSIFKDSTNLYDYLAGTNVTGIPGVARWASVTYYANTGGITTSDLYLITAECLIRTGKIRQAMDVINKIRERRIFPYSPVVAETQEEAMSQLQKTSRVELLFSLASFINLKRWNAEGRFATSVERVINGKTYHLDSHSPLWVFPFPKSATDFNNTLSQNY